MRYSFGFGLCLSIQWGLALSRIVARFVICDMLTSSTGLALKSRHMTINMEYEYMLLG